MPGAGPADTMGLAMGRGCIAPRCGDNVIDSGEVCDDGNRVDGDGCFISQAAASMLTEAAAGRELNDALELVEHFRLMLHGEASPDEDLLGDAVALEGVARYPVRVKCALLSWLALRDAIAQYRETTAMGG